MKDYIQQAQIVKNSEENKKKAEQMARYIQAKEQGKDPNKLNKFNYKDKFKKMGDKKSTRKILKFESRSEVHHTVDSSRNNQVHRGKREEKPIV